VTVCILAQSKRKEQNIVFQFFRTTLEKELCFQLPPSDGNDGGNKSLLLVKKKYIYI
jgi:hypothetical protein